MNKIRLIGIKGDQNYEAWRLHVREVLDYLNLSGQFEEVNDVDVMLSYGLEAIPALAWGNTILLEQNSHIPDTHEIALSISEHLDKVRLKMKNIFVPTDFSESALNAFRYALEIANHTNANIKLGHVCYPNVGSINGLTVPGLDELTAYKEQKLNDFFEKGTIGSEDSVDIDQKIEKEVIVGFPKEELIKRSKDKNTDLIIMGTTGSGSILDQFFGSVSSDVAKDSGSPVWLIPPNAKYKGIRNILYPGNYQSADEATLNEVSKLSDLFGANIHMVHVATEKNFEENKLQELVLNRLFKKKMPNTEVEMHTVISDRVWEGLDVYANENNIDLIVVATKYRKFWENLRHRSISKEVIFHTKTPLLIIHLPKEKT